MNNITLEQLLRMIVPAKDKDGDNINITPEFRIAVQEKNVEGIHIIIHPMGHNGETLDFVVVNNELTPL